MTASFQRNARDFAEYLSTVATHITRQGLTCSFIKGGTQAYLRFPNDYAALGNGCTLRILQRIAPHADIKSKVTTLEYIYAFRIGSDPQTEPLVRYEYLSEEAIPKGFRYPRGHVHLSATVPAYDALIERHEKKPLHQVHFPAGRISLEDFIELLVVEFHVPTYKGEGTIEFLKKSKQGFLEERKTKD